MTCQELSDKMPAVARGLDSWSDAEAAHLRPCADCRAEWAVVSAGAAVGQDASLDADALAARVLERLRTEPVVHRFPRARWLVGLAAAAAIAIIFVPARLPRSPAAPQSGGPAAPPLAVHVSGLTSLNSAGLTDVLESFDTMWTETSTTDAPSLDDLDPQELEQVRGSWEI
jgi:hypothetical protein